MPSTHFISYAGFPGPPSGDWILLTGFWEDTGTWDDTAFWID